MPDIGLRDWKGFDRAIQEGYDTARACIELNDMASALAAGDGQDMPHMVVAT